MSLLFFLRPARNSGEFGGHFIETDLSSIFIFKGSRREEEIKALPEIEELEPPEVIEEKLEKFDAETRELLLKEARDNVLRDGKELFDLEQALIQLTIETNRLITLFEDELLFLLLEG